MLRTLPVLGERGEDKKRKHRRQSVKKNKKEKTAKSWRDIPYGRLACQKIIPGQTMSSSAKRE